MANAVAHLQHNTNLAKGQHISLGAFMQVSDIQHCVFGSGGKSNQAAIRLQWRQWHVAMGCMQMVPFSTHGCEIASSGLHELMAL